MQIGEIHQKTERVLYRQYNDTYDDSDDIYTFVNVMNFRLNSKNSAMRRDDKIIDFPNLHTLLIGDNTFPIIHDFSLRSM